MSSKTTQSKSAKQVINAKVAAAKAAAENKVQSVVKTTKRTVVDPERAAAAAKAVEAAFSNGEALNTCNTIKHLTRLGYSPLEIIEATGFNKVTVYRQSAEAHFTPAE